MTTSFRQFESDREQGKQASVSSLKNRTHLYVNDYSISECGDLAFFNGKDFARIFGTRNSNYGTSLTVVKIYNPITHKTIRRLFRTSANIRGMHDYVGLSYSSLLALSNSQETFDTMDALIVSKGSIILYYLRHPNHCTFVMIWLGYHKYLVLYYRYVYRYYWLIEN